MASLIYRKIVGTTQSLDTITLEFIPPEKDGQTGEPGGGSSESNMPVLVDFWRQADDPNRSIVGIWGDLVRTYQDVADVTITETSITQVFPVTGA
jgi:hypothetical protein